MEPRRVEGLRQATTGGRRVADPTYGVWSRGAACVTSASGVKKAISCAISFVGDNLHVSNKGGWTAAFFVCTMNMACVDGRWMLLLLCVCKKMLDGMQLLKWPRCVMPDELLHVMATASSVVHM